MKSLQQNLNPIDHRPTVISVDLSALADNFRAVRTFVAAGRPANTAPKIMAIVKANAYGHGLLPCARRFEEQGVDAFGVAFVEEGIELRRGGIKTPILVLGGISGAQIKLYLDNDLEFTASSVAKLEAIDAAAALEKKRAKVHLKIDTGMERIGVHYYTADSLLEASLKTKHIEVAGIFSHFATGEDSSHTTAKLQLERFQEVLRFYEKRSIKPPIRHMANSGAMLQFPDSHFDLVRLGIALYGVPPARHLERTIAIRPALTLSSSIVYFKVVKKGAGVSYGHSWHAPTDTRVVTVPIGYGDGYSRAFSNRGEVLIRGARHRIVGNICMDQLMVDLGPAGTGYNGDEVILIGEQSVAGRAERITVLDCAEKIGTVPHEILTSLNLRIPRTY